MANRQHGKSRSPAGSRIQSDRRTGRAVPAPARLGEAWAARSGAPGYRGEPEVRRWPHPVEDPAPAPGPEPALHYIRCALSYQNQLLADIKVLLEQLAAGAKETGGIPDQETGGGNLSKL